MLKVPLTTIICNVIPEQTSYRQIFRATSLFGGVQAFNIVISILRSKLIALLIGPAGMGIVGLLTATTGFVSALTNFGLGTSAVKNVAIVSATGDKVQVAKVVTVLRKLVWITGSLGMVLTALLSSYLSQLTFGSRNYTIAFVWISITLLFQQLSSGQLVVLQGLRKLNYLAKANLTGSIIGLLISVPVYFIWRLNGIVPVIILSSFFSMVLSWHFARKVGIIKVKVTKKEALFEGKEMLKMGFMINLSGLIATIGAYLVRIYISKTGGFEEVGLYTAGFAIIGTYVGMIFTAMSKDYFPRLSAVAHDNNESRILINHQAEIATLILAPILAIFLVFVNWFVILFYSTKFEGINEMILWAAIGMYFKAASWSVSIVILAKGASSLYFRNELLANIYILIFNIVGYKLSGLEGLGISFMVAYFVYFIQVFFLAKHKYSFSFKKAFYKVAGIQVMIGLSCFLVTKTIASPLSFVIGSLLVVIAILHSVRELNKRIDLVRILRSKIDRKEREY